MKLACLVSSCIIAALSFQIMTPAPMSRDATAATRSQEEDDDADERLRYALDVATSLLAMVVLWQKAFVLLAKIWNLS